MLHIVNGDTVADKLRLGGVQGDIMAWREIYTVGPAFRDMADPDSRAVRAAYLEEALGIPQSDYLANLEAQERQLGGFGSHEEVVLWFEHDLFDQTMLWYLLHWFAKQAREQATGDTALSLICIGSYPGIPLFRGLGQLSAEQLSALSGTRQPIGALELAAGSRLWEAYAARDAGRHLALQREEAGSLDALPFAREAFEAHLSRLPSTDNGLGIVEQTALALVAEGMRTPYELFRQAGDRLHLLGMGDLEFWRRLARMAEGPYPLVHAEGVNRYPTFSDPAPSFQSGMLTLTELGRQVLAGEADWAELQGTDDWLGGIRLQGTDPSWRWDHSRHTLLYIP